MVYGSRRGRVTQVRVWTNGPHCKELFALDLPRAIAVRQDRIGPHQQFRSGCLKEMFGNDCRLVKIYGRRGHGEQLRHFDRAIEAAPGG